MSNSTSQNLKNNLDYKNHWDGVYTKNPISKLGWYENESTPILELINQCQINKSDAVFMVGSGATTLVDSLLQDGYNNIVVNDISQIGLASLRKRIGLQVKKLTWIVDDLVNPTVLKQMPKVKLWIDRAVLHFFTEVTDQQTYFDLLKQKVALNGFVILAEFKLNGAKKCSGLDVKQYDTKMLSSKLGQAFCLINNFDYVYTMPNGDMRNYVYTLFKRVE